MTLVNPHGPDKRLKPLLLQGQELADAKKRAESLPRLEISTREASDMVMLGIGAFTPLDGFMGKADWQSVCDNFRLSDGTFWPIPITLSASEEEAASIKEGDEVALVDTDNENVIIGTIQVREKYSPDKEYECQKVFTTTDTEHPGVDKVLNQGAVNLAGPVKVFNEGAYPERYPNVYMRPDQTRKLFEEKGWSRVAALQLRNPMHRSHEFLAKLAIETCDGVLIHQILGKLKPGDIPADVRVRAIDVLTQHYFVENTSVQAGLPLEMRYGGPREALLHAVIRQNFGCTYLIVGRDHAGAGDYYGPFDAHKIFDQIPADALEISPIKVDWTFYCHECDGMASGKTCPHPKESRVVVSGTMLRKALSEGGEIPDHFTRPEVLEVLQAYYQGLEEKVEVKLHKYATGEE